MPVVLRSRPPTVLQCTSAVVWEGGYILGAATSRYNAEEMTTVSWLAVLNRARFLECLSQTETRGLCQSSRKDYFVNVVYSRFILQQYIRSLTASRYVPYKPSRFSCDKQSRTRNGDYVLQFKLEADVAVLEHIHNPIALGIDPVLLLDAHRVRATNKEGHTGTEHNRYTSWVGQFGQGGTFTSSMDDISSFADRRKLFNSTDQ
ncbi:hypothetical protein AFLA70_163g002440 [Aspergillus flavus AF70]|nr:hypothetical protein AFLA70_163g002440 [Aspergillus flavus AF70]